LLARFLPTRVAKPPFLFTLLVANRMIRIWYFRSHDRASDRRGSNRAGK
jgi:hypothetical protein